MDKQKARVARWFDVQETMMLTGLSACCFGLCNAPAGNNPMIGGAAGVVGNVLGVILLGLVFGCVVVSMTQEADRCKK